MASKPSSRVRGNLLATDPKAKWILLLNQLVCTALGTYLSQYSLQPASSNAQLIGIGVKVALGVASSAFALLHHDSFLMLVSFTLPLLIVITIEGIPLSLAQLFYISVPGLVFALSKSPIANKMLMKGGSSTQLRTLIPLATSFPIFLVLITGCSRMIHHHAQSQLIFTPTIILAIASYYVYYQYTTKNAHKNGNLNILTGTFISNVVVTTVLMASTANLIIESEGATIKTVVSMFPFLIGALVCTTVAASFASVADVWYVVGTGQFQTISIDTAGIGFYFILPVLVLASRFWDKYGSMVYKAVQFLAGKISSWSEPMLLNYLSVEDNSIIVYSAFVTFIVATIGIGISVVQSLCPLGGHIFGRVYTHGQPGTKKVAISIDLKDLYKQSTQDRDGILKMISDWKCDHDKNEGNKKNSRKKACLNINVTASDLEQYPDQIKELCDDGHEIAIAIDDNLKFSSINRAHELFVKVLGEHGVSPTWYHTRSTPKGASPRCHILASSLGMRSAMWSNFISMKDTKSIDQQLQSLESDMNLHRGGLFIYIHGSSLMMLKQMLEMIKSMNYIPTNLSSVAKEQSTMDLS